MIGANGTDSGYRCLYLYGNLEHSSGSVEHMGDNLTGEGDGDDEQIIVDLTKIPQNVEKIALP